MKARPLNIPSLYVEGVDDVSTIAALLRRHGYDTAQGKEHLWIKPFNSVDELLAAMPDTIKTERSMPCGFVLDIDIGVKHRWQAVKDRLRFDGEPTTKLASPVPDSCPSSGYIGQVDGYPKPFGIWLMPDCASDNKKLEDLIQTLIPAGDPLWPHAVTSTQQAATIVDDENSRLAPGSQKRKRFRDVHKVKAEVHTWLAWQDEPGASFGAAINNTILNDDSPEALAFLKWLSQLYGFTFATVP